MAKRSDAPAIHPASMSVREAAHLAVDYLTSIIGRQPARVTGIAPSDEGGWIAEAELVEDHRIPWTADILALYEVELDADGDLLAYRRTHRYMRGNRLSKDEDNWTVDQNGETGPL
jgi:hypothetical protein